MFTVALPKYFILFNILATLSQHLPLQRDNKQTATIIVSATAATQTNITTATTTTNNVNTRDFVETPAAITASRTTSASAFVDEVLPHNDSVANIRLLHAKAIDSSSNSNMTYAYNNYNNSNNNDDDDFQQLLEHKLQEEQKVTTTMVNGATSLPMPSPPDQRLLSRKRRYLIFPEGSSFQLVYDGIFGIVDYTNYLILGITVALAWELPSAPQSEVIEELANRLRAESSELRRNDNATADITYADKKKYPTPITIKKYAQHAAMQSSRPHYINLLTATTPATRQSASSAYAQRLSNAFHAPMHQKYYFYNGSNKYDYNSKKNNNLLLRPTGTYYSRKVALPVGGYYKAQPSDWRRKDNNYYETGSRKNRNHNKNFESSSLKVNPFSKWTAQQRHQPSSSHAHSYNTPQVKPAYGQYPWWNLKSRLSNSLRRNPGPARHTDNTDEAKQQQDQQRQGKSARQQQEDAAAASVLYRQPPATATKHRIYPVFGKRSIADEPATASTTATAAAIQHNINNSNENNKKSTSGSGSNATHNTHPHQHRYRRCGIVGSELSRMERIHVRHHRSTRQALYEKIEKYLDKLDIKHSHQCILRALCETGQKSKERHPGTFVGEIMRTVFTLPEALQADMLQNRIHYKDQRYDRANAFEGNCAEEYSLCQQSLWETHFVK